MSTRTGLEERRGDAPVVVEVLQPVAALGMRGEREDLAVDAERTDAELGASPHRRIERRGIVPRDGREIRAPDVGLERGDVAVRRRAELDRRDTARRRT